MTRTRTYNWEDPKISATASQQLSGLEFLLALQKGELPQPPIFATMDFESIEVAEGKVSFFFRPQEFHYNPIGMVHGGVMSTILDSAMGCTVHSALPAGVGYTSLELKVNFLRPVSLNTGLLKCEGNLINLGQRTALVEAKLLDENQKLYAHGVSTCMIFR
jgi:uncharacterized protein (TIGR00369 family)